MDNRRNCHGHLWILSGTGDGPPLVKALLTKGWKISVSVVSEQASLAYSQMPLNSLWIGALEGANDIRRVLENAQEIHDGFDWVVDATHPFAQIISSNLQSVCVDEDQPLLRFERHCETIPEASLIKKFEDLINFKLTGQRILFAIGSRALPKALKIARLSGAIAFARVMPTVDGLVQGLSADLPPDHLAVLKPIKSEVGGIEEALCRKWGITGVVARESGGPTQDTWQRITQQQGLDLWLISRPAVKKSNYVFHSSSELVDYL